MDLEKCMNPIRSKCKNANITVYIEAGEEIYPICESCWLAITDDEFEWDKQGFRKTTSEENALLNIPLKEAQ